MNDYQYLTRALDFCEKFEATYVDVETDDGISRMTVTQAVRLFDELNPGESFTLLAIHFDND